MSPGLLVLLANRLMMLNRAEMPTRKLLVSINSAWNFVNFRAGLIRALVDHGFEVVAVSPDDGHRQAIEALGCRFIPIAMDARGTSPSRDARLCADYMRVMHRERPDVYLGYTIKPNVYGSIAAHLCGIPVINNVAGLGTAFLGRGWLNRIARILYRLALRPSRTVFFQNMEDRDAFVADGLVKAERTQVLPGSGVDLGRFAPAGEDRPAEEPVTFLLVARLLWAKGVGEYAAAAEMVSRSHPNARFQILGIFGDGKDAVDRESVAKWEAAGTLRYLGEAADVRPYIAAADCIVLPSYYPEGTPRTLLEAGAMGKALITTDTPGCRRVVDHGSNGYICAPRDAEALAGAMRMFLALDAERSAAMGKASREKMQREFDEQLVIRAYLAAIDSVAPLRA